MEKSFPEAEIFMPLRMGWQASPLRRPVADQFIILCCSRSREMGDSSIDPSNGIRGICAIDRNIIADEEIFCNILLNPLAILIFLPNRPSSIAYLPDLKRRFIDRLAERWS
jgi:hypothetical protein